ncbi:MAG: hypothetical protein WCC90_07125, partial [Methylocella sp.]
MVLPHAASFSLTALVYNLRRAPNILGVKTMMAAVRGCSPGVKEARYWPGWTMQTTIAPSQ